MVWPAAVRSSGVTGAGPWLVVVATVREVVGGASEVDCSVGEDDVAVVPRAVGSSSSPPEFTRVTAMIVMIAASTSRHPHPTATQMPQRRFGGVGGVGPPGALPNPEADPAAPCGCAPKAGNRAPCP